MKQDETELSGCITNLLPFVIIGAGIRYILNIIEVCQSEEYQWILWYTYIAAISIIGSVGILKKKSWGIYTFVGGTVLTVAIELAFQSVFAPGTFMHDLLFLIVILIILSVKHNGKNAWTSILKKK